MAEVRDAQLRLRGDRLDWRAVEGEVVALDRADEHFLAVNEAGALLWSRLAAGASAAELERELVDAHALSPEQAARDVAAFLTQLRERGLLEG